MWHSGEPAGGRNDNSMIGQSNIRKGEREKRDLRELMQRKCKRERKTESPSILSSSILCHCSVSVPPMECNSWRTSKGSLRRPAKNRRHKNWPARARVAPDSTKPTKLERRQTNERTNEQRLSANSCQPIGFCGLITFIASRLTCAYLFSWPPMALTVKPAPLVGLTAELA